MHQSFFIASSYVVTESMVLWNTRNRMSLVTDGHLEYFFPLISMQETTFTSLLFITHMTPHTPHGTSAYHYPAGHSSLREFIAEVAYHNLAVAGAYN